MGRRRVPPDTFTATLCMGESSLTQNGKASVLASSQGQLHMLGVSRQMRCLFGRMGAPRRFSPLPRNRTCTRLMGRNRTPPFHVRGGLAIRVDTIRRSPLMDGTHCPPFVRRGSPLIQRLLDSLDDGTRQVPRLADINGVIGATAQGICCRGYRIRAANQPRGRGVRAQKAGEIITEKARKMIRGTRGQVSRLMARRNRALSLRLRHFNLYRPPLRVAVMRCWIRAPRRACPILNGPGAAMAY